MYFSKDFLEIFFVVGFYAVLCFILDILKYLFYKLMGCFKCKNNKCICKRCLYYDKEVIKEFYKDEVV